MLIFVSIIVSSSSVFSLYSFIVLNHQNWIKICQNFNWNKLFQVLFIWVLINSLSFCNDHDFDFIFKIKFFGSRTCETNKQKNEKTCRLFSIIEFPFFIYVLFLISPKQNEFGFDKCSHHHHHHHQILQYLDSII